MEGIRQAHEAAHRLPPLRYATFRSSDLPRAAHTAQIVGDILHQPPVLDAHIRDWNTGDLAGQKVVDVVKDLKKLIDHPEKEAPHGEALRTYLNRFVPLMRELVASPQMHLVVGHARGSTILEGIADPVGGVGGGINPEFLFLRPHVHPGGILTIDRYWQTSIDNPPGEPRLGESQPSLGGLKKAG